MITEENLKRTPLYDEHVALGARMVGFGGWDMPVQYEGIIAEYDQTRTQCALFDISHMGEFIIEGDLDETGLDRCVTMNLKDLPVQSARYGAILNEQGGILDDTIIFRLEEKKWFIVVNGARTEADANFFLANLKNPDAFKDVSAEIGKIDIQGPTSRDILEKYVPEVNKLNFYGFDHFDLLGENVLISRTGYTGELGYEIYYPWKKTKELWNELLSNEGVEPAGLGARDVLRIEVGYSLYGHELAEHITPLESGLERFVDFEKEFIGKEALVKLKEEGITKKLVGITSDSRRSPRAEQLLYAEEGNPIGEVTSGTFSPFLEKGIGLGFIKKEFAKVSNLIYFGNEKNKSPAKVTSKIFFKDGSLKS